MLISGIQYMRPDGRKSPFTTEVSDDLRDKWGEVRRSGLRLASEHLITNDVSVTLENDEGDFDIEVTPNAPGKPVAAVEAILRRFDPAAFTEWAKKT